MVIICDESYNEDKYNTYFEAFSFPLSAFQKHSIQAIVDGNHTLVTAHTGSGKTLPIEFAIQHFIPMGKRIVYLGPLKSLVDQKFYDFTKKFPDVTFGIMTSDVKFQPNAQVLIMTTEIFMNYLFSSCSSSNSTTNSNSSLCFEIDIQNELASVVFDEVHFILDEQRGHVWEKTLMMLPSHIQLIMLSATLEDPIKLAKFVENRFSHTHTSLPHKEVVLSSTSSRIVPLHHYAYMVTTESIFKKVKDKETQKFIRDSTNCLHMLKTENGTFDDSGYATIKRLKQILNNNQVFIKRSHVLNTLAKHLVDTERLPAIFFTFRRKAVEQCAEELTTNVLEFDSKVPYTARRMAEQVVRKLPNYQEYLALPEYEKLVQLLEKGIAIHHSGMIPILREIVELFIESKMVKILFATDSFSVGLNCAIKTTVFTSTRKFNGIGEEFLEPHLYSQCAGRAGRRGMDTVGTVIHCNNLFDLPSITDYKEILCGKPQKMESKFRISYDVILNLIKNGKHTITLFDEFVEKSMFHEELSLTIEKMAKRQETMNKELDAKETFMNLHMKTPPNVMCEYLELQDAIKQCNKNNKRKEMERKIMTIKDQYNNYSFLKDLEYYQNTKEFKKAVLKHELDLEYTQSFIKSQIRYIVEILQKRNFIECLESVENNIENINLTQWGRCASHIAEIHPCVFVEWLMSHDCNCFQEFSTKEIIGVISCFTDVRVKEDIRLHSPDHIESIRIRKSLQSLQKLYQEYEDVECVYQSIGNGSHKSPLVFDIVEYMMEWSEIEDEVGCKMLIQSVTSSESLDISAGDFTKAVLKICVIAKEWINVCEQEGLVQLMHKLSQIEKQMMKYICTNQSLYI
jgi:superfamily II RNA helicase